jgi:hypothetical protein
MSNMEKIAVWGFRWALPFAQGLVRDLRDLYQLGDSSAIVLFFRPEIPIPGRMA